MANQARRRSWRRILVRLLTIGLVGSHPGWDDENDDPPTLYEQLDDLYAEVAEQESRWRRNLGSRRR